MSNPRLIEVFSAGCGCCQDAISLVRRIACSSCQIEVLDMSDPEVANRAKALGLGSVPAVLIDGVLASCCSGNGPDEASLRAAGLGQSL